MPIKIMQAKLNKSDRKDKYSRHRSKIKSKQSTRNIHYEENHVSKLIYKIKNLTNRDENTYIGKRFLKDGFVYRVLSRGLVLNYIDNLLLPASEIVFNFDDIVGDVSDENSSGKVIHFVLPDLRLVPFLDIPNCEINPVLNNARIRIFANYILDEKIQNPNLKVAWLVSKVEYDEHHYVLEVITDQALIMQNLTYSNPKLKVSRSDGEGKSCPVCLEPLVNGDGIFELRNLITLRQISIKIIFSIKN